MPLPFIIMRSLEILLTAALLLWAVYGPIYVWALQQEIKRLEEKLNGKHNN